MEKERVRFNIPPKQTNIPSEQTNIIQSFLTNKFKHNGDPPTINGSTSYQIIRGVNDQIICKENERIYKISSNFGCDNFLEKIIIYFHTIYHNRYSLYVSTFLMYYIITKSLSSILKKRHSTKKKDIDKKFLNSEKNKYDFYLKITL